jgi:hypothetical protein
MDIDFFRRQGWVFLGGREVILNLSYSQEETANAAQVGEDFHFYQQNPTDLAAGRSVADPAARSMANQHLGSPFWEVRNWDMGVHALADGPLKDEYGEVFRRTAVARRQGSSLKLMGAPPERVSPTVVFGAVQAGFLRIRAVVPANAADGAFDAYFTILKDRARDSGFKPETAVTVSSQTVAVSPDGAVLALSFEARQAPAGTVEVLELR